MAATLFASFTVDKFGRKILFLTGSIVMIGSMAIIASVIGACWLCRCVEMLHPQAATSSLLVHPQDPVLDGIFMISSMTVIASVIGACYVAQHAS